MSIENLDFKGVCTLMGEKENLLVAIDSQMFELFASLESIDATQSFAVHQKIEELRFSRNKERSAYMDLSHQQKTLKRRHFESKFMQAIAERCPATYQQIESCTFADEAQGSVEISMLIQKRANCYRKLENSFNDQCSMLRQKHIAQSAQKEDLEWEARLEHALSKSRRFFSRQCNTIKFIRERIFVLSAMDYGHHFYLSAVKVLGKEAVAEFAGYATLKHAA